MSILKVPSNLQKKHYYQGTMYVFPQPAANEITVYEIVVRRKADPITVTIGVDHTVRGFNGNETGIFSTLTFLFYGADDDAFSGEWTGYSLISEYPQQCEGGQSEETDQPDETDVTRPKTT